MSAAGPRARAMAAAGGVADPEIPVVTIAELGMLRGVEIAPDGFVTAKLAPTYSGCPAMAAIEIDVMAALAAAGFAHVRVEIARDPPWTTDAISDEARAKLRAYGIAPPAVASGAPCALFQPAEVPCPRCGSLKTEPIAEFGSTPCKALRRCRACAEPFDYFKPF